MKTSTGKKKNEKKKKNKSVTTSHQSESVQPSLGKRGSIMFNGYLEGQMP